MPATVVSRSSGYARNASEARYPALWRNLIAAHPFHLNPRGGNTVFDFSRFSTRATMSNMDPATDWVVSQGYGALDFDGTDDFVTGRTFTINTEMSALVWFKTGTLGNYTLVGQNTTNYNWELFADSTGKIWAITYQSSGAGHIFCSGGAYVTNAWQMAGMRAIKSIRVDSFLNQLLVATSTTINNPAWDISDDALIIGKREADNVQKFNGQIATVLVWDRFLSAGEFKLLYELGPNGLFTPRPRSVRSGEAEAAATVNVDSWYQPLSVPVTRRTTTVNIPWSGITEPTLLVEPTPLSWYRPTISPARPLPASIPVEPITIWAPVIPTVVAPELSWFQPVSVPVLPRAQTAVGYLVGITEQSLLAEPPPLSWYTPLSVPTLPPPHIQPQSATAPLVREIVVVLPDFAWFQLLSVPTLPSTPRQYLYPAEQPHIAEPSLFIEPAFDSWFMPLALPTLPRPWLPFWVQLGHHAFDITVVAPSVPGAEWECDGGRAHWETTEE